MSSETIESLSALQPDEQGRLLHLLDDYYSSEDWMVGLSGSELAAEGEPLPAGFVQGVISDADAAMDLVRSTEVAWRLDVLEVLQDFF